VAGTSWSTTDRLNCTVSGAGNLTVTAFTAQGAVRTIDKHSTGKYYFEYTCTTWPTQLGVGVANASAILGSLGSTGVNASLININGAVIVNNTTPQATLGSRGNGNIIGIALDLPSLLIWYRVAPAGNWNGIGTANPATPAGGVSISAIASALPLFGVCGTNTTSSPSVTANFGDSVFSGAVPAGFTVGFPAGADVVPVTAGPRQSLIT
jgi:hypothetical protein